MPNLLRTLVATLPKGQRLPAAVWLPRHRLIVGLAACQAVALLGVVGLPGVSALRALVLSTVVGLPLTVAALARGRRPRALATAASLLLASMAVFDVFDGSVAAELHFLVMVAVVALYQDWAALLAAVGVTFLHHGLLGLDGAAAAASGSTGTNPWLWAGVHGCFLLALSATHLASWKLNEQLGLRDQLTELANRTRLIESLNRSLTRPGSTSVLFIDLDDFKAVNDSRGHATGDELLQLVAARLRNCVRADDVVARLGGDEFALALAGDVTVVRPVADRVLAALAQPFTVDGRDLAISASMGLADADASTQIDAEALLRQADLAMYLAKSTGKHRVVVFAEGMERSVRDRADLIDDLAVALPNGELEVYYQPTVTVRDGLTTGWEALLRWVHPTRGMIGPVDFIPIAEETGHIIAIGEWVLTTAVAQTARWSRQTGRTMGIAVNLSPLQLADDRVVALVTRTLVEHDLPPSCLTLEITEGVLVHDPQRVSQRLDALRALGVRIAIDDFGTGYSSLSYLRRLPVDTVKIDRSFINDLSSGGAATTLVATIIELARSLELHIVAEGVETAEQASLLLGLDCPTAQGYLYSRPVPASVVSASLDAAAGQTTGRPATSRAWESVNAPA